MDKAIITGATGLLGMSVAKYLSSFGVQLVCLGRQNLSAQDCYKYFGEQSKYIRLAMKNITALPEKLKTIGWGSCEGAVFYNFAWSGNNRLADGVFSAQLQNAVCSAEAVKVAKAVGCGKFISAGSFEETFIEAFLKAKNSQKYESAQANYGLAKLASRDMCKIVAYIEGIDYIHTRMSVPLDSSLSKGGYIVSTMRKILNGEGYEEPQSTSLFDLVLLEDVARAYHLIGQKGVNKADYYIGTGKPATLGQHFEYLIQLIDGQYEFNNDSVMNGHARLFDIQKLRQDTGFLAALGLENVIAKVSKK